MLSVVAAGMMAAAAALLPQAPAAAQPAPEPVPSGLEDRVQRHRGFPAVPAASLEGGPLTDVTAVGGRLRARLEGDSVVAMAGSPFVRRGERIRQVPNAPYLEGGELWLPVSALAAVGAAPGSAGPAAAADTSGRSGPWRVVVDPGHGGRDPGARGPGGTQEKDVVLAIGRKVRDRLEAKEGIEASLTRDGDEFLALDERSRIAVQRDAHLFVSIHANAVRDHDVRGFETFFLGEARTEESRRVAMRENAAIQYQEDSDWSPEEQVEYILTSADQRLYAQESNYLAGYIQNRLRRRHPASDRGVKPAGFYVLMGATGSMPAVLVEAGFISNPTSERYLASQEGQAEVAEGVAEAVTRYFRERERRGSMQTARR